MQHNRRNTSFARRHRSKHALTALSTSGSVAKWRLCVARRGSGAMRDSTGAMKCSRISQQLLRERHRPLSFPRPAAAPTATPEGELSLANPMGEFDAGERDGRVCE